MQYFNFLITYLLYNLHQIKIAAFWSAYSGLIISLIIEPFSGVGNWVSENVDYISIALGFIAVDHALGSVSHRWYKKDFDIKKNLFGLLIKLFVVVCAGFIFEGLSHLTKDENFIYIYMKMTGRILICLYPGRAAAKNMKIITKGAFPPDAVIGKMDKVYETANLNEFKNKENESI